jgi:hypothetical protein
MKLIDKSALVAEIESKKKYAQILGNNAINSSMQQFYDGMKQSCVDILSFLDTLEVKDPYEKCVQYDSIKAGIQAHAETYSFNIESLLFNQLTKEQQKLWRKEIEQAVISGGEMGVELARDPRYKENVEVKEVDLELNSFDATVCKICNTYLKEMDKDAIVKALEPYKDGDKVKVIIKAQKGK